MKKSKEELLDECIELGLPVSESDTLEDLEEYLNTAHDDDLIDFDNEFEIEFENDERLQARRKINIKEKLAGILKFRLKR